MKTSYIANTLFVLAVCFLVFTAGIAVSLTRVWPYPIFHDAYRAAQAELHRYNTSDDPLKTDLWRFTNDPDRGVTVNRPGAQPGYTLYTSGDGSYARLIDRQGHLLHEWHLPYSQFWTKQSAVKNPQPDDLVYFRRAEMLPNGDLIALYICGDDTPWGYGMVKLTPDSKIIWRYQAHTHHDFDLDDDGRIATLTHHFTSKPVPGVRFLPKPYLDDELVILGPQGKQLKSMSLMSMLAASSYVVSLINDEPNYAAYDALHPNTVEWLDAKRAKALGIGKAGDIMVMMRQINLLTIVDPRTQQIIWAMRGPWLQPHDPHVLADGNILMFDNLGNMLPNNPSRVIEFNPHTAGIVWSYTGPPDRPLNSQIRSTDQRLANGDTLVTDSDTGRLLEVKRDGTVAWEFTNPIRSKDGHFLPVVSGGMRIDPASLNPDFRARLEKKEASFASADQ